MTAHTHRRSWASIVGIMAGITLIALAVGGWLAQGFNPLAVGYGLLLLFVSLAMK
jgi:Na+-translocating ferredoxin:NAD+ oxidoreductase RnfD subunit